MQKAQITRQTIISSIILVILIALAYSNTLRAYWFFDDFPNILFNNSVHLKTFDYNSVKQTFFAAPCKSENIYRPVAMFSFALNWYFGGHDAFGYHIVNLTIHLLSAIGVFYLILMLYGSLRIKILQDEKNFYIAFVASALWALNPVQIQAITYIVQRMASLAALFYIYAMLTYVLARRSSVKESWPLYLLTMFLFILSTLSKENGILLPFSLLLIEFIFITDHNISLRKIFFTIFIGSLLCYPLSYSLISGKFQFLSGYDGRSFTMAQRLLTEPRVVIYYISLLLFPAPDRLSLIYDFPLSTSLFSPWSTLPSIILLLFITLGAILSYRKSPILSFAILFFLLNHLVESTILPLELVFEHRNYLPSIFFFWPIASILVKGICFFLHRKREVALLLLAITGSYIVTLGAWTYIRNNLWKSEKAIWIDVMRKYPDLPRPYQMLGALLDAGGYYEEALRYYKISMTKKKGPTHKTHQFISLINIGLIYLKTGHYENAIDSFHKALETEPGNEDAYQYLIRSYFGLGDYREAERLSDIALAMESNENNVGFLLHKAFALQKLNRSEEAIIYFQKVIQLEPDNSQIIIHLALAQAQAGHYEVALQLLDNIPKSLHDSIYFQLTVLENELRGGTKEMAGTLSARIKADHSREQLLDIFKISDKQLTGLDPSLLNSLFREDKRN
ncbi:MAG: tetratricopeptide repeat protein [Desulfobulbaceae bacterium]|nr:tetratricopeptide repeat protein [Desulfobulbaceae bacterium]